MRCRRQGVCRQGAAAAAASTGEHVAAAVGVGTRAQPWRWLTAAAPVAGWQTLSCRHMHAPHTLACAPLWRTSCCRAALLRCAAPHRTRCCRAMRQPITHRPMRSVDAAGLPLTRTSTPATPAPAPSTTRPCTLKPVTTNGCASAALEWPTATGCCAGCSSNVESVSGCCAARRYAPQGTPGKAKRPDASVSDEHSTLTAIASSTDSTLIAPGGWLALQPAAVWSSLSSVTWMPATGPERDVTLPDSV